MARIEVHGQYIDCLYPLVSNLFSMARLHRLVLPMLIIPYNLLAQLAFC